MKESSTPSNTGIKALPPNPSPSDNAESNSAQDEFDNFSTKKRMKARAENIVEPSSSKLPEKRVKKSSKTGDMDVCV